MRVEGVPFARHGSRFTRDFECLTAWLAAEMSQSKIGRMLGIDWYTVGRIIARVSKDELDPGRLDNLFEIGMDEVSYRKHHKYLTLVCDHARGCVVWGTEGAGQKAANKFYDELDGIVRPPEDEDDDQTKGQNPQQTSQDWPDPDASAEVSEPEVGTQAPCAAGASPSPSTSPSSENLPESPTPRSAKIRAISMDMGAGYNAAARERAPQAVIAIDPFHVVQLANNALDEVRREHWNMLRGLEDQEAAKRFKGMRWALVKAPGKLNEKQKSELDEIEASGGRLWQAYLHKEEVRALFDRSLDVEDVAVLIDRLIPRLLDCGIAAFVRFGGTLAKHRQGILNAIRLRVNNARAEALNNKVRLITRRAYGFHSSAAALGLVMLACGPIDLKLPRERRAFDGFKDRHLCR